MTKFQREAMMSNIVLVIFVVLLGCCVGLASTNPAAKEYDEYLERLISQALTRTDSTESTYDQNTVRDLLRSQGKFVIKSVIRSNTTRHNYGLFSIFETRALGVQLVVLAIAGTFIPVEGDDIEEATRKLGQIMLTPTR